ncbi:MAG: peroxidase family protein, partial [Nocardioides sp.]
MNIGLIRRVRDDGRGRRRLALLAVAVALAGAPVMAPSVIVTTADAAVAPEGQGFTLNLSDIRFIKRQVDIAERHAATRSLANPCGTLLGTAPDQIPNGNQSGTTLPWGLRTVDGTCNNLIPGQEEFGAADTIFPRLVPRNLRGAYQQKKGTVVDSQPREISNLIVDQTVDNPAAREAAGGVEAVPDGQGLFSIPNVAPDVGLSAPFNSFFTLFGQFFDHGLDLVTKGGGTVFMPLQPGDPLYDPSSPTNFMVLTRATNQPGPDRVAGDRPPTTAPATVCTAANTPAGCDESIDDVQEHTNTTTAFVDQNQTYTSHPAHQAFLREYVLDAGSPADTGRLLGGVGGEGLATWGDIKAEALAKLGVVLTDQDVLNVPMLATDPYGNLELSAGRPQLVTASGLVSTVPGGTTLPADVVRTGHAFLDDIAHHAAPNAGLVADADTDSVADDNNSTTYDDEMLESHFVAGDGRANENIGLTTVHHIFHSEHNRLVADIDSLIATETAGNFDAWHSTTGPAGWDYGQRVFQAARFVTEMEYQHLVFEEFARKV